MAPTDRVLIIAEAGINHNGNWMCALDMCDIAKTSGADAVKFQIYHADKMLHGDRELLKRCELSDQAHKALKAHCDEIGIEWMASCFDEEAVDLCVSIGATHIKVGSGEITNLSLLKHIGNSGKHLILSTGMSVMNDVFEAVYSGFFADGGTKDRLTLLHCVSNYPTDPEHCNLRAMETLRRNFFCPVGFSDHTLGFDAAVAAVALGAKVIEKHFMVHEDCPDSAVSVNAGELCQFVAAVRNTEAMLGDGNKKLQPGELEMQKRARGRWTLSGA